MAYLKDVLDYLMKNSTKVYLIIIDILLVVFGIWFSNIGVLPFKNIGDFVFFVLLVLVLGIYRPAWLFLFFVGTLPLEIVNLAPESLGVAVRPYQLFGALSIVGLIIQYATKRMPFSLPKFRWYDALVVVFAFSGFVSALFAVNKGMGMKQAVVACSFVALYFLVRIYVQDRHDLKRIAPFFLSSSIIVVLYGISQNILFAIGRNPFEVMPGRPNGTFSEADWYGLFLTFVLAAIYCLIMSSKQRTANNRNASKTIVLWLLTTVIIVALILTVSRSAWLGAVVVTLGFLKAILIRRSHPELATKPFKRFLSVFKNPDWSGFIRASGFVVGTLIVSVGIVYVCKLTTFQLGSRAVSTGGMQKITIACEGGSTASVPSDISSVEDLAQYGCRHINLEEVESEKLKGKSVLEVDRPDPNVGIRAKIYKTSWEQIKQHPIFGIGWGNIGDILGRDERGASLNASNIFLETWLGAGILGFLSLIILLGYIFVAGVKRWFGDTNKTISIFILLALFAIIIPNLFNSGIFLGFVWAYLGVAVSLLQDKKV
jgi:hypothetical protein